MATQQIHKSKRYANPFKTKTGDQMTKTKLKVLSVKEKGDTWYITVDTNEEGRRILMQAGIDLALKNMVDDNIDKLSWWSRFKHAWKCSLIKNKRS